VSRLVSITLKGFLCEIYSGFIPTAALSRIGEYLGILKGAKRPSQDCKCRQKGPEALVSDLWYREEEEMKRMMAPLGLAWEGFRGVNQAGVYFGIGSGKDNVGIFEMQVIQEDASQLLFVPPPVHPELRHLMGNLGEIGITTLAPPKACQQVHGLLQVSSGKWGKGEMLFILERESSFHPECLSFLSLDLCDLGIAEEYLVTGISYRGEILRGIPVPGEGEEYYPVVCLPHGSSKWVDLGSYITSLQLQT
jgi:hypothetical protein